MTTNFFIKTIRNWFNHISNVSRKLFPWLIRNTLADVININIGCLGEKDNLQIKTYLLSKKLGKFLKSKKIEWAFIY